MTAYLLIPFQCCGAIQEIHSLEQCISSEFLSDFKHGALEPSVSFQRLIVNKHVELEYSVVFLHVIRAHSKPSIQKPMVCFIIEGL